MYKQLYEKKYKECLLITARGVVGLQGGSEKCRSYWEQFSEDKEGLIFECERILAQYEHTSIERKYRSILQDIPDNLVGKTREQIVQVRVNQSVFRQIVLANYDFKCALSGIDIPELLVASHVIPWSYNEEERMNPKNGICLSSLYDKAFDQGLISFDSSFKVLFSERLSSNVGKEYFDKYFSPIQNKSLAETKKYAINPTFLEWHRDCIFNK